jgi:hypothetical protein
MNYISIEPTNLIQVITKIIINILHIELNKNATVQVLAYSETNELLKSFVFELILPEYESWTNDEWLINYVCDKYGFLLENNSI